MALLLKTALGQAAEQPDERAAKLHVARCEACWPRFKQLVETLMGEPALADDASADDLLTAPTLGERWRLQRHAPEIADRPGRWQRGVGYLSRLTEEVRQQTMALLISIHQFLAGPSLAFASAHRGPSEIILRCADLPDLEATVVITPDAADTRLARVAVEVSIPSRWPDFSGVRVILDDGVRQIERVTGHAGRAEFESISTEKVSNLNLVVLPPI
jgi:hypothetical protein